MADGPLNHEEVLQRQRVLARFGEFALGANNLDDVLMEACRLLGQALRTDLAKVMEMTPGGETMIVRAGVGWRPGVVGVTSVQVADSTPEGLTLKQGAVISPSIEREKRFRYHDFMKDHGVQAFVNVLIWSQNGRRPFGILEVDSRSPCEFQQADIDFLRLYANLLGAAVERLRTVEALRFAIAEKETLLEDLDHRVKNMLATVQSVVSQTLRHAGSIEQAKTDIDGRLSSLAQVHNLIIHQPADAAAIHDLVSIVLEPYRSRQVNRVKILGPDVRVPPRQALALAMVLQELATNAAKYGALSQADGTVTVNWTFDPFSAPARLELQWEESGGPPVKPPSRRGFGSRFIERSWTQDVGGQVRIEYAPGGLVCTLVASFATARDDRDGLPESARESHWRCSEGRV